MIRNAKSAGSFTVTAGIVMRRKLSPVRSLVVIAFGVRWTPGGHGVQACKITVVHSSAASV
jgi:hypothetical protein